MPHAHVNGIRLYYEQEGSGPPLVLISGLTADLHFWDLVRPELAKRYTLVMIDNRGAGQSETPDFPYTMEQMAEDVIGLMDHLKIDQAHVVGHSMGGAIIQTLGYQFPKRFHSIVIAQSISQFHPVTCLGLQFILDLHQRNMDAKTLAQGIIPWLFSNRFLANPKNAATFVSNAISNPHPQSCLGHLHQFQALTQFDSSKWLHQISLPTLVIAGEEDLLCPFSHVKGMAAQIPGAKLVSFPQIGHMIPIEQPLEFVQALDRFFAHAN